MDATQTEPTSSFGDTQDSGSHAGGYFQEQQSVVVEAITALDLTGRMTRNPYRTMLIAAGVGYILGGGLFTRLTSNVFKMGMRVGSHPLVQRELLGMAEAALRARSNP